MERIADRLAQKQIDAQGFVYSLHDGIKSVLIARDRLTSLNGQHRGCPFDRSCVASRSQNLHDERLGDTFRHFEPAARVGVQMRHGLHVADVADGHLAQTRAQFDGIAHGLFDVLAEQA